MRAKPLLRAVLTNLVAAPLTVVAVGGTAWATGPWSGSHRLYNYKSGKCVGVDGAHKTGIWDCTTNPDQEWSVARHRSADQNWGLL